MLNYIIFYLTILEDSFRASIFINIFSNVLLKSYLKPKSPDIPPINPLNFSFKVKILLSPFSKMLGKFRNRNVCPVGAVSKKIISKFICSMIYFNKFLLNKLRKYHCLIDTWNRTKDLHSVRFSCLIISKVETFMLFRKLIGIDFWLYLLN